MTYKTLIQLAEESVSMESYHFRSLSKAERLVMAKASFQRLPEAQQLKVQKQWAITLDGIDVELTEETVNQLVLFRFLAQTNLFFLCNLLEKYSQVTVNTHGDICNDFFVQKNPTFATFEKFANQYSDLKDRMLLVPRGGFKSSIDIADCVQWITCFPAITILILTGVYKLAGDFIGELRQHFMLEESGVLDPKTGKSGYIPRKVMDKDTGEWSDSMFQILFSEHCIVPGDGSSLEFQTPASSGDAREPTVRGASIEQSLSGMHFGVLKLDDVVTNENSQNADRLAHINKQISINRAMLHPYGFMDVIGTWYDEYDFYGITIRQEERFAEEEGLLANIVGDVDTGRFNSHVFVKVYLRAALWLNDEAVKSGKIEGEARKEDYTLWFPERLGYEFLQQERKKDAYFPIKYLNNPRQMHRVKFPRELLMRRTIPHNQLPPQGVVVTTIDTAYSVKSWADYTVILTALIFGGRFYIINMVRGRYNEYELPAIIAATAHKWKPKRIAIEDSMGVKWMGRELRREMDKLQIAIPVEFCSLGLGSKRNSKAMKAKPVLRLLGDERMYFLNSCEGLQEIYTEMEKFTGQPNGNRMGSDDTHDDIVSGLSLLCEQFGAYAEMGAKLDHASMAYVQDQKSALMHKMIYGLGEYAHLNASTQGEENPSTIFQMEKSGSLNLVNETVFNDPLGELMM